MMTGKLDQISGEVKKAGEVLDDSKLKAEGVVQQGVGKTKKLLRMLKKKQKTLQVKPKKSGALRRRG